LNSLIHHAPMEAGGAEVGTGVESWLSLASRVSGKARGTVMCDASGAARGVTICGDVFGAYFSGTKK
jgi:hypothetical protein